MKGVTCLKRGAAAVSQGQEVALEAQKPKRLTLVLCTVSAQPTDAVVASTGWGICQTSNDAVLARRTSPGTSPVTHLDLS